MVGVLPAAIWQLSNQPGAISQASDQMETIKLFVEKKKKRERERPKYLAGKGGEWSHHHRETRFSKETSQFILDMLDLRFLL